MVLGERVNVRARPDVESEVLGQLPFDIVRMLDVAPFVLREDGRERWIRVRLSDGREGFVDEYYLGSPVGYRGRFDKVGGRWLLTLFLTGD